MTSSGRTPLWAHARRPVGFVTLAVAAGYEVITTASPRNFESLTKLGAALVYRDFLPAALADGSYQITPQPKVVGHGVGAIQDALEIQRRGVSAQKIVVTL